MANLLTNTSELTSIADAIRSKTGKSGTISFPNGFVSEIGSISGGGTETRTITTFDGSDNFEYYNPVTEEVITTNTLEYTFNSLPVLPIISGVNVGCYGEESGTYYEVVHIDADLYYVTARLDDESIFENLIVEWESS